MLAPMRPLARTAALSLCLFLLACPTPEERTEQAREDVRQALGRGDRLAALHAIESIGEPDTPKGLIDVAGLQVAAGEAPAALRLLEQGIERWPENDELRVTLAKVALMLSDPNTARAVLIDVGPDSEHHITALVLRSEADLKLGDFDRAVSTLDEAERLYPDRPEARIARIGTLLKEGHLEEAREALAAAREPLRAAGQEDVLLGLEIGVLGAQAEEDPETAVAGLRELAESHPDEPKVWAALVQVVIQSGRPREAITLLRDAIDEDPERLYLYVPLANLLQSDGRPDEALGLLKQLIERSPTPSAYLALARHHISQPEASEEALAALEEGLEAFPENPMLRHADAEAKLGLVGGEAARDAVETYRDRFPEDPNGEYLQARLDLAEGRTGAAIERLTAVMPKLDQAFTQHWLGRALEVDGDLVGAQRRYVLAVQRNPRDIELYVPLVRLAAQRGAWPGVAKLGEQMTRLNPMRPDGWSAWLSAVNELGQSQLAEAVAQRYLMLFPDLDDARLGLARAQRSAGRFDEAMKALDEAEPDFGDPAQLEAERALTLGLSGRLEEGIALARSAMAEHPDSAAVQLTAAALLFMVGEAEEGSRATDRALELAPDDARPLAQRARFRAATGRLEGAQEDCERYLALRPDDARIYFVLGSVQERSGRVEGAIAAYQKAAELDPQAFAPRNNLAYLLADRDLDAALLAAQEAYALRSESPAVLDTLGWLYLRKGLVDRATSLLEEAHAGAPELAEVQLHLALAHREAGRRDEAREHLTALAARDDTPDELEAQVHEALRSLE